MQSVQPLTASSKSDSKTKRQLLVTCNYARISTNDGMLMRFEGRVYEEFAPKMAWHLEAVCEKRVRARCGKRWPTLTMRANVTYVDYVTRRLARLLCAVSPTS